MWKYLGKSECNEFLLSLHLIDCNDLNKYIKKLYSISNRVEDNYRIYSIKKRNGKRRIIYEPNGTLKHIQRQILSNILEERKISEYAKAYHKGISLVDNASPHVGKDIILKLDIKDFFNSISFYKVYDTCFPLEYFPKSVGMLLTRLCTYQDHLTQGSPTAAYISNLVMRDFDIELGEWCKDRNISYTRYSDDMTFSGNFDTSIVISKVKEMLKSIGLQLHNEKICVVRKSSCQSVTGVVVNEKVQVSNAYRKKVRCEVYYIKKYGIQSHLNRIGIDDADSYMKSLYGRILYVLQINSTDKEFINYKDFIGKFI